MGESMGVGVGVGWVREGERGECLNTGWMSERVGLKLLCWVGRGPQEAGLEQRTTRSVRGGIQTPGNACVCTRTGVPCVVRDGVRARRLFFEAFKLNGSGQAFADVDRFRLGVHDVADRGGGGDQEKESERGEGHRCTRLDSGCSGLVDFEIGIGT